MAWGGYGDYGFRPYVPIAKKLSKAVKKAAQVAKKQRRQPSPVKLDSKKIATTFWGNAWCDNLAAYSDYSNRLPRGATYVRNGSVVDLVIKRRTVEAIVAGSETYTIKIEIAPLAKPIWKTIKQDCSASIDSLLDLLAGRFSDGVMQRLTRQKDGLFPSPREIKMKCSCPDWSDCCKHLAAVMYGIGARLDKQPELLFVLRDVDHQELVSQAVAEGNLDRELFAGADGSLAGQDLGAIFGIELDVTPATPSQPVASTSRRQPEVTRSSKSKRAAPVRKKVKPKANATPELSADKAATPAAKLAKAARPKVILKSAAKKSAATTTTTTTETTPKKTGQKPNAKRAVTKRTNKKSA